MTAPTLERPDAVADPPDRFLTRAEVADMLRVSERTIDRLATAGRLTRIPIRLSGKRPAIRYSEREVLALRAEGQG